MHFASFWLKIDLKKKKHIKTIKKHKKQHPLLAVTVAMAIKVKAMAVHDRAHGHSDGQTRQWPWPCPWSRP